MITNVKTDDETIKTYPNSGIYKLYEPLPDDIVEKDSVYIWATYYYLFATYPANSLDAQQICVILFLSRVFIRENVLGAPRDHHPRQHGSIPWFSTNEYLGLDSLWYYLNYWRKTMMKPRQPSRKNPARNRPAGVIRPLKGKGSYNRSKNKPSLEA